MHLVFLTPNPDPPGGGSAFNAGLIPALGAIGHHAARATTSTNLPLDAVPVLDGMVLPAIEPHLDALLAQDAIAVIHHISAAAGRDTPARAAVRAAEARILPRLRRVIATSPDIAARLNTEFGVPTPILLQPGLPDLPRTPPSDTCRILSPGVLTPRKGHDRLLHTLSRLKDLDWTLTIAGDTTRDPAHTATIAALIHDLDLTARVTLLPNPDDALLDATWSQTTLFALATRWEGWPATAALALRRGIPVVASAVGGLPALVPPAAGILCPPDDPATWGKCLRRAIYDAPLRATLAEAAWHAGQALPGWPAQAAAFDAILRS